MNYCCTSVSRSITGIDEMRNKTTLYKPPRQIVLSNRNKGIGKATGLTHVTISIRLFGKCVCGATGLFTCISSFNNTIFYILLLFFLHIISSCVF